MGHLRAILIFDRLPSSPDQSGSDQVGSTRIDSDRQHMNFFFLPEL